MTPHTPFHRQASRRVRHELQEEPAYAQLYVRLCRAARNEEAAERWEEQLGRVVDMLAELERGEAEGAGEAGVDAPPSHLHIRGAPFLLLREEGQSRASEPRAGE